MSSSGSLPYYAAPDYDPAILDPSALRSILEIERIPTKGLSDEQCVQRFKEMQQRLRAAVVANPQPHDNMSGFTPSNIFQAKPTPVKPSSRTPTSPTPKPGSPFQIKQPESNPFQSRPSPVTPPSPISFSPFAPSSSSFSSSSSSKPSPSDTVNGIAEIVVTRRHQSNPAPKQSPALAQTPTKPAKAEPKPSRDASDNEIVESAIDRPPPDYSRYIYFLGLLIGLFFLLSQLLSLQMFFVGYCPSKPTTTQNIPVGWPLSLAAKYIPCKPCPEKATCANGIAICADGLTLSKAGVCKHEQKFQKEKDQLFEKLAQHVADVNGEFLCDERYGHPELSEQDLWRLSENYVKDKAHRERLFQSGINDIVTHKADYDLEFQFHDSERYFRSKNPKVSFSCRTTLFLAKVWSDNSEYLSMAGAAVVVILTITWRIRAVSAHRRKIVYAQEFIKRKLKEQSKKQGEDPFLAVAHVRQTLMETHPDLSTQDWNEVKKAIKNDPRIQETDREVKGEDRVVWEWVASDVLE